MASAGYPGSSRAQAARSRARRGHAADLGSTSCTAIAAERRRTSRRAAASSRSRGSGRASTKPRPGLTPPSRGSSSPARSSGGTSAGRRAQADLSAACERCYPPRREPPRAHRRGPASDQPAACARWWPGRDCALRRLRVDVAPDRRAPRLPGHRTQWCDSSAASGRRFTATSTFSEPPVHSQLEQSSCASRARASEAARPCPRRLSTGTGAGRFSAPCSQPFDSVGGARFMMRPWR